MRPTHTRRYVLGSLAGLAATAGCVSSATTDSASTGENETAETTASQASTDSDQDAGAELDEWLADANGYDGSIPRAGVDDSVSIWVGDDVASDHEYLAFNPAAIEIAPGTTVYWEWSGHGGAHNVVSVDGAFESGEPVEANTGTIFQHTFEETGTFRYVCETHEKEGMKGVIVVTVPPTTGYPKVDEWVVATDNWDGAIVDGTGVDATTVRAGAEGNQGHFAFDPPALKVSTGTTVSWEWTGDGGGHNIAFEEAAIDASGISADPGVHFEHTFEEQGVYRYACEPHRAIGMKGAVVVE